MRAEVPQDIAQDVGRVTGTDLSTVPVFRGPAVDAAAQERGLGRSRGPTRCSCPTRRGR
ncbi:hypothetical protein ACFQV2_27700 [Actinokineospora soli]|uniref:Uncharacterized protein n=1 Tax=Actinokineospora soli TaxID=1048753 RepID=A0ABW2TS84_9PSEU